MVSENFKDMINGLNLQERESLKKLLEARTNKLKYQRQVDKLTLQLLDGWSDEVYAELEQKSELLKEARELENELTKGLLSKVVDLNLKPAVSLALKSLVRQLNLPLVGVAVGLDGKNIDRAMDRIGEMLEGSPLGSDPVGRFRAAASGSPFARGFRS